MQRRFFVCRSEFGDSIVTSRHHSRMAGAKLPSSTPASFTHASHLDLPQSSGLSNTPVPDNLSRN